jgi:hypothetical protein
MKLNQPYSIHLLRTAIAVLCAFIVAIVSVRSLQAEIILEKVIHSLDRPLGPTIELDSFPFSLPAIDDSGAVSVKARLKTGVGGVSSSNNQTLLRIPNVGGTQLFDRTGQNSGAGVPHSLDRFDVLSQSRGAVSGAMIISSLAKDAVWALPGNMNGEPKVLLAYKDGPAPVVGTSSAIWSNVNLLGQSRSIDASVLMSGGLVNIGRPSGLFRAAPDGSPIQQIQAWGDNAPGGGQFGKVDAFNTNLLGTVWNNNTQTAFAAYLHGVGVTATNEIGIWAETGSGLVLVARGGMAAPGSGGTFVSPGQNGPGDINNNGQVAFYSQLSGAVGTSSGIWHSAIGSPASLSLFVKSGAAAPGTSSGVTFSAFSSTSIQITDSQQIGFFGLVSGPEVTSQNDTGIWFGSAGNIRLLARENAPAAGYTIADDIRYGTLPSVYVTNANGQAVIKAELRGATVTTANDNGIFALDPLGQTIKVLREGDVMDRGDGVMRTVSAIDFPTANTGDLSAFYRSFNNNSQLALSVLFSNGETGIYRADLSKSVVNGVINVPIGETVMATGIVIPTGQSLISTGTINSQLIVDGEYKVNGASYGDIRVDNGLLSGTGDIFGNVEFSTDGQHTPGNSPGTQTIVGNVSYDVGSQIFFELNGTDFSVDTGVNDLIIIDGDLNLEGTLNVSETIANSFLSAQPGDSWRLIEYTGGLNLGAFAWGNLPTLNDPNYGYMLNSSIPGELNLQIVAIPEPSTLVLGTLAGLGLGALSLRRRRIRS